MQELFFNTIYILFIVFAAIYRSIIISRIKKEKISVKKIDFIERLIMFSSQILMILPWIYIFTNLIEDWI